MIVPAFAGAVLLGIGFSSLVPTRMLNVSEPRPAASPEIAEPEIYEPTYRFVDQGPADLSPQFGREPYVDQYLSEREPVPEPPYIPIYSDYTAPPELDDIYPEPEPVLAQAEPAPPTAPAIQPDPPMRRSAITASIY